ncbi:tyrosine-type recombinase/integrase [Ellagibacter isourolithinifaciens]|uniref:tyrosine-type recombinase/integrase n=1 Tax=Ellagibacter isourolithinifaciens TaxID=2137581 RepID=UPI003A8D849A
MDENNESAGTYGEIVRCWAEEREILGIVQPYTAQKAEQKASLFYPWLENKALEEIEPATIRTALIELRQRGGRFGKGLSSATLRAAHLAGKQAFDWAIERGRMVENPFDSVDRPKAHYRQARFLTLGQATMLSSMLVSEMKRAMDSGDVQLSSFALAACIALATGMRRGEIFALEWSCCNFKTQRINVSRAVKGDGSIGSPKSMAGIRSVAVGNRLVCLMEEMRAWRESAISLESSADNCLVICNECGHRANMNMFEHWWRTWADENGWEGIRFHDLRHTHATLLISGGTDVKTVQMRLGHSSAEITMSCYAHAIPLSDTNAAENIDSSLFG